MHNRTRVLVVDDDPLFRNLVTTLLRKDYFVAVANDGYEGFFAALEHPPDVAVIDVQMPGWDGLSTLRAFRNHPQLKDVKVMMLTSDASRETVLAAIREGANDYLIKTSFSRDELLQKLTRLLPAPIPAEPPSVDSPRGRRPARAATLSSAFGGGAAVATAGIDEDAALQSLLDSWE
jgi:CheY-like chemotaxis protein